MTPEKKIKELEDKIKKLEAILFGVEDDPRFKAKVRKQIFDGEHSNNKPTVINQNGKRYNLETA